MKLFASLTSPYARKLRILAHELKIGLPLEETSPLDDAAALLAANPLGKVPALVLDDGQVIVDSPVIAAFLLANVPEQKLIAATGAAHWQALTTEALADGILDAAIVLRFNAVQGVTTGLWLERQYRAIDRALAVLAMRIGHSGFGDICIVVACEYLDLRFAHIDWRGAQPALAELQARLGDTPAFAATRPPA
ncbi:glutathione S-transferase N-terminal domain-containing protein [Sandarakinorhabdus sp.]|uniref:glutathione S-transferase N-terminal domain-containing protein n=1 Tax=Sandarakinorhabdus sp. TaxID=1916663 RepID=UPI00286E5436|nr:glutathione S-transferase N-terminal domain-containing protein [Sandarakinorhabdus sp.]